MTPEATRMYGDGLTFHKVTAANWRATLDLGVLPEQQRFVSGSVPITAIALAKAYVCPGNFVWVPFAIRDAHHMVGFIELAYMPEQRDQYWIFHFFIDQRYQRQGYGHAALQQFIPFVRHTYPQCDQLNLHVHPENSRAQRVYQAVGFQPTGRLIDGEPLYTYAMQ